MHIKTLYFHTSQKQHWRQYNQSKSDEYIFQYNYTCVPDCMHITQSLLLFFKSHTILLIVFVLNNLYHLKGFENYGGFLLFFYSHIFSSPCDIRWSTISLWKHCYLFCYTIATQQYSMLPQSIILFFWFVSYRSKCLKINFVITVETFKLDSIHHLLLLSCKIHF